ncbi:MAG: polyribonucleotide nucleotidyltransferase, partial [Cutibacterium granulosum]|nr:polyribonucleotide nucleotidyltransferase [Cutibacterium granulosum]
MEGPGLEFSEAIIDNGAFGKHVVRFEAGLLAQQADGSAAVYLDGDTMLLSTTTAAKTPRDSIDFFPLTVDVEERMYAAGRIPGSFFRREGRPSENAILACRLIDRPIRPSFVKGLRNEVQVVVTVLALNPEVYYDVVAINAASMSTQIAGLPFSGPIGGVRMALIGDQWVCFPTVEQRKESTFDMVVAGRVLADGDVAIMMVEAESTPATWDLVRGGRTAPTEEVVATGLEAAKPFIKVLCDAQLALAAKLPKETYDFPIFKDYEDDVYAAVEELGSDELARIEQIAAKLERQDAESALKARIKAELAEKFPERENEISGAFKALMKKIVRKRVLDEGVRIDGRGPRDIRTLSADAGIIPRVHGSALFQRGETQILGVSTLNMLDMEQKLDTLSPQTTRRYMHNYNMPPYSTGETGRVGSPKRREVGHGNLAERALIPVLPTREEFPYAIRQVSEAIGS